MKKALKFSGYTFLFIIGLILFYMLCTWGLARIPVKGQPVTALAIDIYLKTNGVHTDVVMPVKTAQKDWSQTFPLNNTRSTDSTYQYIAIGWGDKGFYLETPTWSDLKARTAFNAAFGLGSSAIHATYYQQLAENERCVKLRISKDQYTKLIQYVEKALEKNAGGNPMVIGSNARYGNHDAFYEATGNYSLFHTCNTWTNNALKASGQKACWWTPFDKGIFYHYR